MGREPFAKPLQCLVSSPVGTDFMHFQFIYSLTIFKINCIHEKIPTLTVCSMELQTVM